MHSQRRPMLAARQQSSVPDEERQTEVSPETDSEIPGAQGRLFFERRRQKPVETSWPEAMDTVHRHLAGLESANRALQESESRYRALFLDAPVGMFQMSPGGQFLDLNEAMAKILGFESANQALEEVARGEAPVFFTPGQWDEKGLFDGQGYLQSGIDLQVNCRNGEAKWVRFNIRAVREDGRLVRFEGVSEDVTNRKRTELKTEVLAYYDLLTGLPNRTLFNQRLTEGLAAAREQGRRVALFLVEVERFKAINDSLGDMFGDRLLQETAARIKAGTGEESVVARVGGAEFAIMMPKVGRFCQVETAAKDLVARLSTEHSFLGHSLNVSCNVGVSVFPESGTDSEMLMKRSDMAMCRAREDNTNRFAVFTEVMNGELMGRMSLESGLRQVLSRNELFLEYQPQVDILTGEVTGLEALLRWNHRQRGLIPPNDFIDIAESSGLIVPIGEWVLRSACAQSRAWQESGLPAVPVAVNVSAIQFRQQGFCDTVRDVLRETGLRPDLLELELTESLLLANADVMTSRTAKLRAMGVMLAIDDFGTGYSSLGYLKQFRVNRLKIARPFVKDLPADVDSAGITTAIIEMARALNLAVLAEGVENEAQLAFLRKQQCYTIQGFYFSKPAPTDKVGELLRTGFGHLISAGAA